MAENKNTQVATMNREVSVQINKKVQEVLAEKANGFEMAFIKAEAISQIKELLTNDYMKPIMALQGNKLGFKTDKDKENNKYDMETVKNCLIEAVLMGVEPTGNQFNIIAANTYITKEGMGHLLSKIEGLYYEIIPGLPRINSAANGAAIEMKVKWTYNSVTKEITLDLPVKYNSFVGTDGVIGKATRKARAWLYGTITGSEIPEGDASEFDANKTVPIQAVPVDKESERIFQWIEEATTIPMLEQVKGDLKAQHEMPYEMKMEQLKGAGK